MKDYLKLVVDLITGLAWPVIVVLAFISLRKQIKALADSLVGKVQAASTGMLNLGPVGVQWTEVIAQSTQTIERLPGHAAGTVDQRREVAILASSASEQPSVAIIAGYEQVRTRLMSLLSNSGAYSNPNSGLSAYELARLAASGDYIDEAVADTVGHITVLRNLATNSPAAQIDSEQAQEYVKLVEEALYRIPA